MIVSTVISATADDRAVCVERNGQPSIDACGRIIAAHQLVGKDLATIYVLRASIYRGNKQYENAINDISHAIDLLASTTSGDVVASAYVTRASIYSLSGDLPKALADYQRALALDNTNSLAAAGVKSLQAQLAAVQPSKPDNEPARQLAAPNEPLPTQIPIPPSVLQIMQTNPFFTSAPPVRVRGYSYAQLNSNKVNGFRGGTTSSYDVAVKWLRPGMTSERIIMQSKSTYVATTMIKSESTNLSAANGLIGLGYYNTSISYIPRIKPKSYMSKNILVSLGGFQGSIFPIQIGTRFSYKALFHTVMPFYPDDEMTETELCEFSQKFDARTFHPDLTGFAYLETCQDQKSYKRNIAMGNIGESRTLFFEDLGVPIRVDPQSPPQRIIQTYFGDDSKETARLQSFLLAR